jgi:hypothetical protein
MYEGFVCALPAGQHEAWSANHDDQKTRTDDSVAYFERYSKGDRLVLGLVQSRCRTSQPGIARILL